MEIDKRELAATDPGRASVGYLIFLTLLALMILGMKCLVYLKVDGKV